MFRIVCIGLAVALTVLQFVTQAPAEAAVRSAILATFILICYGVVRGLQRIWARWRPS